MTTNKPATPLPWGGRNSPEEMPTANIWAKHPDGGWGVVAANMNKQDATYIVTACNVFPQLVATLRRYQHDPVDAAAELLLKDLGESE